MKKSKFVHYHHKRIPRKFRKDNQHYIVQSELPVIKRQELSDFRSHCEITRIRRDEYTTKCIQFDEEAKNIIQASNLSEEAAEKLQERWNSFTKGDIYMSILTTLNVK